MNYNELEKNARRLAAELKAINKQMELLNASPDFNDPNEMDDLLCSSLSVAIELNEIREEIYNKKLTELENVKLIDEDTKTRNVDKLKKLREEEIESLFGKKNDSFEGVVNGLDLQRKKLFNSVYYEKNLKEVRQDLDQITKITELKARYGDLTRTIETLEGSLISFENIKSDLDSRFNDFATANEIYKYNKEELESALNHELRLNDILKRNSELMKESNIQEDYTYNELEASLKIDDIKESLYFAEMADAGAFETSNLEEELVKRSLMRSLSEQREADMDLVDDEDTSSIIKGATYRGIFFAADEKLVRDEIEKIKKISDLKEKANQIEANIRELENISDEVKTEQPKIEKVIVPEVKVEEPEIEYEFEPIVNNPIDFNKLVELEQESNSASEKSEANELQEIQLIDPLPEFSLNFELESPIPEEDKIQEEVEEYVPEVHIPTIGDVINVKEGTKYTMTAYDAVNNESTSEISESNMIAIPDSYVVDHIGIFVDGQLIGFSNEKDVSVDELAERLGVFPDTEKEVVYHIHKLSTTSENFDEGQIGWINAKNNRYQLITPASER